MDNTFRISIYSLTDSYFYLNVSLVKLCSSGFTLVFPLHKFSTSEHEHNSKGQLRSYLLCNFNLTSMQAMQILHSAFFSVFSWEKRRFCKNLHFLLRFDVRFHILSNTSSVVFFLFSFSSQLRLECLLLPALNRSLPPPPPPATYTKQVFLQGNGRESLWLGRLITVYSLIQNSSAEHMAP